MSVGLVKGLLFAAISINMIPVECSIKTAEAGTSKSEKIMSVQGRWFEGLASDIAKIIKGIYPGTKWCGSGNVAANDSDFGPSILTDKCCKEHDSCDNYIEAGHTRYGLTNTASHTVSDCDCDEELRQCLIRVITNDDPDGDTTTAKTFGLVFFKVVSPKCLKYDHPYICASRV